MLPLCPNKAVCGSCSWSHLDYENQLKMKLSDVNGSFALKGLDVKCTEIIPAPTLAHYRNRMDFVIDFEGRVGMRAKDKWWKVIDNHTCFLADTHIEELFAIVRTWTKTSGLSFYDRRSHEGLLRYAIIRATRLGDTMIVIVTSKPSDAVEETLIHNALTNLVTRVGTRPTTTNQTRTTIVWSINDTQSDTSFGTELQTISGSGFIEEKIGDFTYRISPNAFFQTNSYASPILLETVKKFCGNVSDKRVLDLYCGTGFFSIALASQAKETIGVELVEQAIVDARINAERNNLHPLFIAAPTENYDWSIHNADLVILDPPRSGMHDRALADILHNKPKTIVYVSCNPKNFAREMVQLQKMYAVSAMIAIDLFPHTPHVELVTKLICK
ncbi:MAG: 23S rRNA (uracil(1939)-C(5))-methyltransferase RlmD [Patescibacteria group bacterium]